MRRALFSLLLCSAAIPASAGQIITLPYDENAVVPLTAMVSRAFDIKFSNDDRIKYFVLGKPSDGPVGLPQGKDSAAPPAVHVLPIEVFEPGVTNLLVDTVMPDDYSERTYHFVITVLPEAKDDSNAVYELRFTYKQQEQQVAQQAAWHTAVTTWKEKKAAADRQKAEARLSTDVFYGERNFRYIAIGDQSIAPHEASDNGWLSAFRFPGNTELPSAYIVDGGAWCDLTKAPPSDWLHAPERTARTEASWIFSWSNRPLPITGSAWGSVSPTFRTAVSIRSATTQAAGPPRPTLSGR